MDMPAKPVTRIGTPTSDTKNLKTRGRDSLKDIVGKMSFSEAFYFIVTGKTPNETERNVFDSCLTILMDHGLTPNAVVARLVEDAVPDDIQVPIAAGILMVGGKFVGTMVGAGRLVSECVAKGGDPRSWAAETVARFKAEKRRIPGFGHPYYFPTDPRQVRLFEIAAEAGVPGKHIAAIKVLSEEIDKSSGKHLTLNATGACGALLAEIGFPVEAMRAVAVVSRAAGLVAHIYEEKKNPITPAVSGFVNAIPYEDPA